MSNYYIDTSALIKRYLTEPESEWVKTITDPEAGNVIIVCDLTSVEFYSAMVRRVREGEIPLESARILQTRFLADLEHEYLSVALENTVLEYARDLLMMSRLSQTSLRSLDSIQLASAVVALNVLREQITFVSADNRLLDMATFVHFDTDNPNNHL